MSAAAWRSPGARAGLALGLVLLLGCVFHGNGAFFRPGLHLDLLGSKAVIGLCALGQCLVILGGGIDLSVGSVLALANVSFAGLMLAGGAPWWVAAPAAIALGTVVGAGSGALVARLRIQPFLATLATMVVARGLARFVPQLAGEPAGSKFLPGDGTGPPFWQWLGGRLPTGLPTVGAVFALAALAAGLLLRRTVAGRHLVAIGDNREAARLAGVPVRSVEQGSYALSGAFAALAGICLATLDIQGNPGAGEMFELEAIAAVAIGGTSLRGGRGGIGLCVLGVLIVGYIDKVLSLNGLDRHWRLVIQGLIIVLAVCLQDRRR